jgi:hypothetical protein
LGKKKKKKLPKFFEFQRMSSLTRLLEAEKENASDDDDSSATTNATPQRTTRAMKRKATQQTAVAAAVGQSASHLLPSTPHSARSEKKRKSLGRRVSFSSTVDVRHFLKGALDGSALFDLT